MTFCLLLFSLVNKKAPKGENLTVDSDYLRDLLCRLLPGLEIEQVLRPSGQRVVYFTKFKQDLANDAQVNWGSCVLKATEELSHKQIAYLQKEIEILNSLNSPFYPKLFYYEVFTHDPDSEEKLRKRLFVTIEERIPSAPLSDCRNKFGDAPSVLALLEKLVSALSLLWRHDRRLIHRDIKPDNILIKNDGDVVVIDLGIVREEGSIGLTEAWHPFGPCSPPYASPEQAKNDKKNISFKSDFFSLGTLAYELLSGVNPFYDNPEMTREDIFERIVNHHPQNLHQRQLAPQCFSNLVNKMMSKHPYQRHRTIEVLVDHISEVKRSINAN